MQQHHDAPHAIEAAPAFSFGLLDTCALYVAVTSRG